MPVDKTTERKIRRARQSGLSISDIARDLKIGSGLVIGVFKKDRAGERMRGPCEYCGKYTWRLDRHHTDYIKGIVVLICPSCHGGSNFHSNNILRVRLKPKEMQMLDGFLENDLSGIQTRSEFIRLLIYREHNRRKRLGPPKASDWQADFRVGRPPTPQSQPAVESP